jgi:anti-sigma-K factor RskA
MPEQPNIGVDERELDDLALEALAEAYAVQPNPGLRGRVLVTARAEADAERARRGRGRWRAVGALAATVALALGGLLAREAQLRGDQAEQLATQNDQIAALARTNGELTARLETQERTLVGLRESLESQGRALRILGGPRTLSASLSPKEGFGGGGRVHVDADTGEGAIVLAGVETLPQDKVYELWAIRGDNPPEPAGLLAGAGRQVYVTQLAKLERPGEVKAFAVSIEPAGGSKSPTGPIVLVGTVQG